MLSGLELLKLLVDADSFTCCHWHSAADPAAGCGSIQGGLPGSHAAHPGGLTACCTLDWPAMACHVVPVALLKPATLPMAWQNNSGAIKGHTEMCDDGCWPLGCFVDAR